MGRQYTSYATNTPRTVIIGEEKATETLKHDSVVSSSKSTDTVVFDKELEDQPYMSDEEDSIVDGDLGEIESPEITEMSDNSILIKMRFFTLIIALTAFIIAGCAAFFSISGLTALFAGAFWSIVVMGSVLEVGKLVATSFLYRYWEHISLFLKSYLMTAIFVLMVITSAGIFGYLSRAHIEQQGNIQNATVIVERIDSQIEREQLKISNLNERMSSLKSEDVDYSDAIARQESIRDSAWDMVQSDIDFEQSQINDIQSNLNSQFDSLDKKYELDLADLNSQQDRIENELRLISDEEKGLFSKNQTDLKQTLRDQQAETINKKDGLREKLSNEKSTLRIEATGRISDHQNRISEFRTQAQSTIDSTNNRINELRKVEDDTAGSNLERVSVLQSEVDGIYSTIDGLNDERFDADAKVRLVESEVGPVKYVAEAIYGNTETTTLERAIRMLIIMIIFVFDPLAVALVLAYNSLIMMDLPTEPIRRTAIKKHKVKPVETDNPTEELPKSEETSTQEEHRKGLFARFHKVRTRSGKIKNLKNKDLAETEIK